MFRTKNDLQYLYSVSKRTLILVEDDYVSTNDKLIKKNKDYLIKKFSFLKRYGFLKSIDPKLKGVFTKEIFEYNVSKLSSIVFEVTEACNLACKYCCWNDCYEGNIERCGKHLDLNKAKKLIRFIMEMRKTSETLRVSFYGGEPLLRIDLIKEIVTYSEDISNEYQIEVNFGMTTNALLLKEHIEYLSLHKFDILISLDGNEHHNELRVNKEGQESYFKVIDNVNFVKDNYKNFFDNNISFNCVLNKNSNMKEIFCFFKEHFNKTPHLGDISIEDVKEEKNIFLSDLKFKGNDSNTSNFIESNYPQNSYRGKLLEEIVLKKTYIPYKDYYQLIHQEKKRENVQENRFIPAATCFPFDRRIYVNAKGMIFACERINDALPFGNITNESDVVFFQDVIIQKMNFLYNKVRNLCEKCYNFDNCSVCLLKTKNIKKMLEDSDFRYECEEFCDKTNSANEFSHAISFFEVNPTFYNSIINEINYY